MWFLSLVFSTRYHPYLPCAMLQQKACHSFSTEKLLMRTKNKAIHVMCNAQVKCYSNTINLWKAFYITHKAPWFPQWMNEWWMAWHTVVFTTHILKRGRRSRCFHLLPSHYMIILTHCCSESLFIRIVQFNWRKRPSYHIIHSSCKFLTATRQNKSLVLNKVYRFKIQACGSEFILNNSPFVNWC